MGPIKKQSQAHRPVQRPQAETPRSRYVQTQVTKEDKLEILRHCKKAGISVSQFLAELAMQEAQNQSPKNNDDEEITLTLRLPRHKKAQLNIFAKAKQKSLEQLVEELLLPNLEKRQTRGALQTESLTYYLTDSEHQLLMEYLNKSGLSARTYVGHLAVTAISKRRKKP